MEIFVRQIEHTRTRHDVTRALAAELHKPEYSPAMPINFHLRLFFKRGGRSHKGCGALTVPSEAVGKAILQNYFAGRCVVRVGHRTLDFKASKHTVAPDILQSIQNTSYRDPALLEDQEQRAATLQRDRVLIPMTQFGWECRDYVFSVEWECSHPSSLSFDYDKRQICLSYDIHDGTSQDCLSDNGSDIDDIIFQMFSFNIDSETSKVFEIVIDYSQIAYIAANAYSLEESVIYISLNLPPLYRETGCSSISGEPVTSIRLPFLPFSDVNGRPHSEVSSFLSLSLRLLCSSFADLDKFRRLAAVAAFSHTIEDHYYSVEHRFLFSQLAISTYKKWLETLPFPVAFQIDTMFNNSVIDPIEIMSLHRDIEGLVAECSHKGFDYATMVLREFASKAADLFDDQTQDLLKKCFIDSYRHCASSSHTASLSERNDEGIFDCLHVFVSPTAIQYDGPLPELSNRVIRSFGLENSHNFIRMSFVDEGRFKIQYNRNIDGVNYVESRIGPILREGLAIIGRKFHFLAYSQSALKEHAVWFLCPFQRGNDWVDVPFIIQSIGTFDNVPGDSKLMYCPARYAARISQGFTTTEPTTTIVDRIITKPDIDFTDPVTKTKWNYTDGVGTMSPELAKSIQAERQNRRKGRKLKLADYPRALQIRLAGAKGVLSVDYTLEGKTICLRDSMTKFVGTPSRVLEIAKVFDKPGQFCLNRPLIMLLEGLGVPYNSFKKHQDIAVAEAHKSKTSLDHASHFLDSHGLGTSFRLSSVLLNLAKLGTSPPSDGNYETLMEYAINHVLRNLKHKARIPVHGAWNLVGIADIFGELAPREVFACIKPIDKPMKYLKGLVLVSRSPTIHPGDVQLATAIGPPPPGSNFAMDSLPNTIVFSTKGSRPLCSCLGGGDLDGDEYIIIPLDELPEFAIPRNAEPSQYEPAKRKVLDRPCTHADIAAFVMSYITSDLLGYISITWRIIADQQDQGIHHSDCIKLADLHSRAVDYPKSGNPVPISDIPRRNATMLPDWYAPETMRVLDPDKYYPSQKAIGRLFRDIDLPSTANAAESGRRQKRRFQRENKAVEEEAEDLTFTLDALLTFDFSPPSNDPDCIYYTVEERVHEYLSDIDPDLAERMLEDIPDLFLRYRSELQSICSTHSLSQSRGAMLTEEEAIVGTIVSNTSQPRKRADHIRQLREQTDLLVRGVRSALSGDKDVTTEESLARSYGAWRLSLKYSHDSTHKKKQVFGAQGFGWVALGGIFEAIKDIEEEKKEERRNRVRY